VVGVAFFVSRIDKFANFCFALIGLLCGIKNVIPMLTPFVLVYFFKGNWRSGKIFRKFDKTPVLGIQ